MNLCHKSSMGMSNKQQGSETALSPSVKNLLCSIGIGLWEDNQNSSQKPNLIHSEFLDKNGILNIDECFKCLELSEDVPKDISSFERAAFKLSPAFRQCEDVWSLIDLEEFLYRCKPYFGWTGNARLFLDCYGFLKQKRESRDILALLLLCTGVEQGLRKIYTLENVQCPMLLKDILAAEELQKYLGKASIQLFHILLGPPTSMNLRNVAWHGFLSEGEISPRYSYFLLLLMASLSSQFLSVGVDSSSLKPRQYFPLSKVDCVMKSFPDLSDVLLNSIKECVLNSWVAGEWKKGLIADVFDLHCEKQYGFSSVQGFPILEHALRQHFVSVNNCGHRLLTAEASSLYTTYEEILDCYLPDGEENKLVGDLGEPFMDLLHDLLIYPMGPRARDRLGHGEADVYDTPPSLSSAIIVCLCYLSVKGRDEDDQSMTDPDPCIQNVIANVDDYESHFHPVAELKEKILALSLDATQIHNCLRTDPELQSWSPESKSEIFTENNSTFKQMSNLLNDLLCTADKQKPFLWNSSDMKTRVTTPFSDIHDIVGEALEKRVSTLHRWQKKEKCLQSDISESEIVGLMHRIISEMLTVLDQTKVALEQRQKALDNRLLRSRQRDNMKRLIYLIPNLVLAANYQTIVWIWLFDFLNQPGQTAPFKRMQKFLKSMLQTVENLRTYTSNDNNKWTKADEILVAFVQAGVELIGQLGRNV